MDYTEHTTAAYPEVADVPADRDQSTVEHMLDELTSARVRLTDVVERAQRQLAKVQSPNPRTSDELAKDERIEMRLSPIAERIRGTAREFDTLTETIAALLSSLDI